MIQLKNLLNKTREINKLIQKSSGYPISFEEMAQVLSNNINANTYIIGNDGQIMGYAFIENFYSSTNERLVKEEACFPLPFNEYLLKILDTKANITRNNFKLFHSWSGYFLTNNDNYSTVIPIFGGGERLGTLMLSAISMFDSNDLILAEYGATVIGMEILHSKSEKIEHIIRQKAAVSIAISTLSHTEYAAIEHILDELGDNQGQLVTSKIAKKIGVAPSVVVTGLRKLESARVVSVRSLGRKGTYIKVLNNYLLEQLENNKNFYLNV